MDEQVNVKALDRYLSKLDVWAMAFGCMVGWGAFVMPGTTFLPVAGPLGTAIAMVLGVLVMLVIEACTAWLMNRSPRTGGIYSYTKEAFGRDHAFLCAWFLALSYLTVVFLNGSALFVVIRTLLGDSIQTGFHYTVAGSEIYLREVGTSVLALSVVGLLFVVAKPMLQKLHTALSVILFTGVALCTVISFPKALASGQILSFGTQNVNKGFAIFSLMILAPWAFVGFEITSFETAHFRFPSKKSGSILLISILMAGFAYISMAFMSISVLPDGCSSWQEYISRLSSLSGVESVPTFYAAKAIMGQGGLVVISITAVSAILTGIIGAYRALVRVLSTMAEDKILSGRFSRTTYSILFVMALSILISLLGRNTLIWFVDLTSFGAITAYGYTCAAAIKAARAESNRRIMFLGILGTIISIAFVLVQLIPKLAALDAMGSEAFLLLSLWCLLGFVFYWGTIQRSPLTEYSGISTSGIVLFSLLVYSALMWLAKQLAVKATMDDARRFLGWGTAVLLLIIFTGLMVMLYIQNVVRKKHEASEREKIRAVESSLAKSQFLFNMSHDIRTPMNAIMGYTGLAKKEESPETVKEYLNKIEISGRHLLELINDILEMSRIESGKTEIHYEPEDICRIFEDVGDMFADQMRQKGLEFAVHDTQVQHRYVWCDKGNLNRILLNVISNAYKFTPAGGSISATLFETAGDNAEEYSTYEIQIQDSGIGMSREFVDKMFTAFERERNSTDSGVEGTGLGLAITKNLVDLMGGTIDVLTSPGSGTQMMLRFKLRLASEEDVKNSSEDQTAIESIDFSGKRLLLVEDNQINMEIASMILSQQGFIVETAENGKIAVDMVAGSVPGYYDAVLMDIQMPVMDGYSAAKAIRALDNKELAAVPILAMTANAFKEDVQASLDAGMQAHIAKPIDVKQLMEELRKVLG
ncbi:MAG: amino acid permease [Firmicutes bacterium]|nr:amino acid permease [Bacillota bacterium]